MQCACGLSMQGRKVLVDGVELARYYICEQKQISGAPIVRGGNAGCGRVQWEHEMRQAQ